MRLGERRMPWFRIWGYEWLEGSIRRDLTGAERAVWADLLAVANMSRRRGHVERSEGIPYTIEELAHKFKESVEVVESAVEKCLKEGRLAMDERGSLVVTNWSRYQTIPEGKSQEEKWERKRILDAALCKREEAQREVARLEREVASAMGEVPSSGHGDESALPSRVVHPLDIVDDYDGASA